MFRIREFKVNVLPSIGVPNARYYVPNGNGSDVDEYITDKLGNFRKVNTWSGTASHTHTATDIIQDSDHRFVSDLQIASWDISSGGSVSFDTTPTINSVKPVTSGGLYASFLDKVDKVNGKQLSTEDFTTTEKTKLSDLSNYTHPSTHPATIIVEDSTHRFTTDIEKSTWNAKQPSGDYATNSALTSGLATKSPTNHSHAWTEITSKPNTFTPSLHTHVISDTTGLQAALDSKQSSGNYAPLSHTHTSTNISDFTEAVQDAVAGLLGAGSNVILNYNDPANTLEISATGSGGTGLDVEQVRDAIGIALVGIGNIAITVNDASDTITISTTATQNISDAASVALMDNKDAVLTSNFNTALAGKADISHTQAATTITGLATVATSGSYNDLSNKPTIPTVTGTNTGDETTTSIKSKLGITTLSGSNTGDQDLSGLATTSALTTGLAGKANTSHTHAATDITQDSTHRFVTDTQVSNWDAAVGGSVPADGTITNAKLATDIKVGSLASLTTTEKGSVVGAINEVKASVVGGGGTTYAGNRTIYKKDYLGSSVFDLIQVPSKIYSVSVYNSNSAMNNPSTSYSWNSGSSIVTITDTLITGDSLYFDVELAPIDLNAIGVIDATPTVNSTNAISSGGVDTALKDTSYTLANKTLKSPSYTTQALTDGATTTLNALNGTIATWTIAGNRTFAISNAIANTYYQITITQDATGSRLVTWPTIKWRGGTAPTLTTAAGSKDIITLWYDGASYYGNWGADYK